MTAQDYIENELKRLAEPIQMQDRGKTPIEDAIFAKVMSKKFRKVKADEMAITITKKAIHLAVKENKPIAINCIFGGNKLWRLEEGPGDCAICGKQMVSKGEGSRPKWQWNMESNIVLCPECYDKKQKEYEKRINFCVSCNTKLGFVRYNPKPKWEVEGQLCRQCWDKRNETYK